MAESGAEGIGDVDEFVGGDLAAVGVAGELEVEAPEGGFVDGGAVLEEDGELTPGAGGQGLGFVGFGVSVEAVSGGVVDADEAESVREADALATDDAESGGFEEGDAVADSGVELMIAEDGVFAESGADSGDVGGEGFEMVEGAVDEVAGADDEVGVGLFDEVEDAMEGAAAGEEAEVEVGDLKDA